MAEPIPPPGKHIHQAGMLLGLIVGVACIFGLKIGGAIPGALIGLGGVVIGGLIAKPIALSVNEKHNKK